VDVPEREHCVAVGAALATLHEASSSYRSRLANRRGPGWWRQAARAVRAHLTPEQEALLAEELEFQAGYTTLKLPKAAIHADLFCDNVLFREGRVAGIIDFGFAATDFLAYDLAIAINDWSDAGEGQIDGLREEALLAGYRSVRPLSADECDGWPLLCRAAALRFWLSRLYDLHLPRPGELTHAHDPVRFERILRARVASPARIA
jgi:homoserine kinase type II